MKRYLFLIQLAFVIVVAVNAQEPLTLEALVARIVSDSFDYKDTVLSLSKAEASYDQNMANLFPVLSLFAPLNIGYAPVYSPGSGMTLHDSLSLGISPELKVSQYLPTSGTLSASLSDSFSYSKAGSIDPPFASSNPEPSYSNVVSLGVSLVQPLFFENAYQAALTTTEETFNTAKLASLSRMNVLVYQAAGDYYRLKISKYALSLATARLADTRQSYEDSKKKYEQGILSRLAFLNVEAALRKAELDLMDSESSYKQATVAFASAYGLGEPPVIDNSVADIPPTATPATADELFEIAGAKNLELAMERKAMVIADAMLVTTKYLNAPLTFMVGPKIAFDKKGTDSTSLGDAFTAPFGSDANTTFSMGVSLSCTLFDAGQKEHKIREQAIETERKRMSLESQTNNAKNNATVLFAKIERNKKALEFASLSMQVAQLEYEAAKSDYEHGGMSRLDFSSESIKRDDASLRYMQARIDSVLGTLEISLFMGDDLVQLITRSGM